MFNPFTQLRAKLRTLDNTEAPDPATTAHDHSADDALPSRRNTASTSKQTVTSRLPS